MKNQHNHSDKIQIFEDRSIIRSAAIRLRQYLLKASFSSAGDRFSALECVSEIEREFALKACADVVDDKQDMALTSHDGDEIYKRNTITIKTWFERMPEKTPDGVLAVLAQAECMKGEINDLRAELAQFNNMKPVGVFNFSDERSEYGVKWLITDVLEDKTLLYTAPGAKP